MMLPTSKQKQHFSEVMSDKQLKIVSKKILGLVTLKRMLKGCVYFHELVTATNTHYSANERIDPDIPVKSAGLECSEVCHVLCLYVHNESAEDHC